MESVLESTVREGDESMTKVPQVTLRCLEEVGKFAPFVDWLHRNIKGWNPTSSKPDSFACSRCHKELPFADGGAMVSFQIDSYGWTLYMRPVKKGYEFAMCLPCLREVLAIFGMKEQDIENYCESCKPRYIQGEYVVVDEGKRN